MDDVVVLYGNIGRKETTEENQGNDHRAINILTRWRELDHWQSIS